MFGKKLNNYFLNSMSNNKLSLLISGSNSQVFAYGQNAEKLVLKVVSSLHEKQQGHLKNEFLMLKRLQHQNIIKVLRYQQKVAFQGNKMDKQLTITKNILVIEYASQGSLLQYIQKHKVDIPHKRSIFIEILSAVQYLHAKKIAHRDLKLQNILVCLDDATPIPKISDFGFASHFQQNSKPILFTQIKGTRKGYMAPQIHLMKTDPKPYHAPKCDVFALGVILFTLMFQKLPFEYAISGNRHYRLLIQKKYQDFWNMHSEIKQMSLKEDFRTEEFKDLFQRMVNFDPNSRPQVQDIMGDPWLI